MRRRNPANLVMMAALTWLMAASAAGATTTIHSSRSSFNSAVDAYLWDDFSAPGYATGDVLNVPNVAIHTDANVNGVLGETQYRATGRPGEGSWIFITDPSDPLYCSAGCQSFEMTFTDTSYGNLDGVFGVAFRVEQNYLPSCCGIAASHATVTFGNGIRADYPLDEARPGAGYFWGITSSERIAKIHLGGPDGAPFGDENFDTLRIDNLTIASPEPGTAILVLVGFVLLGGRQNGRRVQPRRAENSIGTDS